MITDFCSVTSGMFELQTLERNIKTFTKYCFIEVDRYL